MKTNGNSFETSLADPRIDSDVITNQSFFCSQSCLSRFHRNDSFHTRSFTFTSFPFPYLISFFVFLLSPSSNYLAFYYFDFTNSTGYPTYPWSVPNNLTASSYSLVSHRSTHYPY